MWSDQGEVSILQKLVISLHQTKVTCLALWMSLSFLSHTHSNTQTSHAICWLTYEQEGNEVWTGVTASRSKLIETKWTVTAWLAVCLHFIIPALHFSWSVMFNYLLKVQLIHVYNMYDLYLCLRDKYKGEARDWTEKVLWCWWIQDNYTVNQRLPKWIRDLIRVSFGN